ncbi:hypothetical protein DCF83_18145 (plasmid) [Edwardsiella tarda]|uniref:hypothetical protein n=1 Tax=Edwardsiella tarda TaxID=636 RepID=UPI0011B2959D|nr:hypothetical protein [Edwardsiella tarda]UCQ29591.1 hypothetical protein DCF83_18145 [Edwardsiella tarda]
MNKIPTFVLAMFFIPLTAFSESQIQVTNLINIYSLIPQKVVFIDKKGCRYYGNTEVVDKRGGVSVTCMVCSDKARTLKAKAYMTEYNVQGRPDTFIPAGNIWTLTKDFNE